MSLNASAFFRRPFYRENMTPTVPRRKWSLQSLVTQPTRTAQRTHLRLARGRFHKCLGPHAPGAETRDIEGPSHSCFHSGALEKLSRRKSFCRRALKPTSLAQRPHSPRNRTQKRPAARDARQSRRRPGRPQSPHRSMSFRTTGSQTVGRNHSASVSFDATTPAPQVKQ